MLHPSLTAEVSTAGAALDQEVAQGGLILGAWLGSLLAGRYSERWGCRRTLLRLNLLFTGGAALSSLPHPWALVLGRLILGLAVGCEAAVVPVLLSEIAPPAIRGKVVPHGWRWLQAAAAAPAVMQVVAMRLVPESPRWLAQQRRRCGGALVRRDASGAAVADNGSAAAAAGDEFDVDLTELARAEGEGGKWRGEGTWGEVFARRGMVLTGVSIMALSALTGINSVMLYSTAVFALAGIRRSTLVTAVVAAVNVAATVAAQRLADTSGRRALLLRGVALMTVSLVALAAALLGLGRWPIAQVRAAAAAVAVEQRGALAALACLAFITGYAIGFGTVGWTVISELVPSRLRSKAYGLFVSANWASNLVVSSLTLTAIDALGGGARGVAHLYLIFAAVSAGAFCFVYARVRETMGLSLEDLHSDTDEGADALALTPQAAGKSPRHARAYRPLAEEEEELASEAQHKALHGGDDGS
ncbi:general substrate transporter [Tribonema minus]|uniref:Hexose transporter 1 n=1 Tax=Tribonema minus TaxID=303371 RepID=A0A835ZGF2_9STRA|nr:general substrate transporter [Tribonema minus]